MAELWDRLTWLRGRSFVCLRTTSWTLTQVGLEVSKVSVPSAAGFQSTGNKGDTAGSPVRSAPVLTTSTMSMSVKLEALRSASQSAMRFVLRTSRTSGLHSCFKLISCFSKFLDISLIVTTAFSLLLASSIGSMVGQIIKKCCFESGWQNSLRRHRVR